MFPLMSISYTDVDGINDEMCTSVTHPSGRGIIPGSPTVTKWRPRWSGAFWDMEPTSASVI